MITILKGRGYNRVNIEQRAKKGCKANHILAIYGGFGRCKQYVYNPIRDK